MMTRNVRGVAALLLGGLLSGVLSGCFSLAVQGEADQVGPTALIIGDPHLRAGAAVNVYLRSVDDQPLSFWQSRARVPSGERRLLVDCTVVATGNTSRHELKVALESGVRYRLSAETTSQACTAVNLDGLP